MFFWMHALSSLALLIIARYFFVVSGNLDILLLSFLTILSIPILIPLITFLKREATMMNSPLTLSWVLGGWVILVILLIAISLGTTTSGILFFAWLSIGIYYGIDSRIFFSFSLVGLVFIILALVSNQHLYAESTSITVYVLLVMGIVVELFSSSFAKLHAWSHRIINISQDFIKWYRQDMSNYALTTAFAIAILWSAAMIWSGKYWIIESEIFVYIAWGVFIFYALFIAFSQKYHTLWDFFMTDNRWMPRWLEVSSWLYLLFFSIGSTLLAAMGILYRLPIFSIVWMTMISTFVVFGVVRIIIFMITYAKK